MSTLLMDYHDLSFAENSCDGVYTIETLSHAYDIARVLAEFSRVLRPGASLSLCEYTMAPDEQFDLVSKRGSDLAIAAGSLRAMPDLRHGAFAQLLGTAGFVNVHVETHTTEVLPSLRRLRRWSHHPARVLARLGLARKFKNTMVADSWASLFEKDLWRYVTVTATKPQSSS